MHVVPEHLETYTEAHTTPPAALLQELAEETRATLRSPQMLAGTVQGRFLEMLVHAAGARSVLEIGTYSGYSALSMAAALPEGGRIDTCEVDEEHARVAQRYFDRSPHGERITLHLGPALETVERLGGPFDLVFVDADKFNYANYYEAVLPRLSERGLIAFDNTLWGGKVLDPGDDPDEDTRALVELNESLVRDSRVICVQLPIRDGLTLVRRATP
jgi:caffeoyl-CoA O-methyltransferase